MGHCPNQVQISKHMTITTKPTGHKILLKDNNQIMEKGTT